jgi:hypothetical protein
MSKTKVSQLILAPKEAYRLFERATLLADALEDVMESHGSYSKEFTKGLKLSLSDAKAGKLKKILSLKELK